MAHMLAVRHTNKGAQTQVQVYRNNNGTFIPFGNPYTPASITIDSTNQGVHNLAAQFGTEFYCSAGGEIRIYNPSTQNWDLDQALSVPGADHSGLFVGRGPSGALRLVVAYRLSNILHIRHLDAPGGAWSAATNLGQALVGSPYGWFNGLVFDNELHIGYRDSMFVVNLITLSSAKFALSGNGPGAYPVVRAKNRIFTLVTHVTANTWSLIYEYIGGSWSLVVNGVTNMLLPQANGAGQPFAGSPASTMHYDEASDSLIVHGWEEGAGGRSGWKVTRVVLDTWVETDISATVVVGGLANPTGPSPSSDARFAIEVDVDTDPTTPVTYIWNIYSNLSWGRFQWNGIASPMTALGTGGDRGIALVSNPRGGGEYFYSGSSTASPAFHVEEVQARVPLLTSVRAFFRGELIDETGGAPTPVDKVVALYYGKNEQTPDNLATILNVAKVSGPGSAPSISGNKIQNFTFDGTSIYSVEWQAVTNGFVDTEKHMLMPHVEV